MAGEIQRWNAYRVETYLMQSKFLVGLVYVFFVARGGKMCALFYELLNLVHFFSSKAKTREMEKNSVERSLSSKLSDKQKSKQIATTKKKILRQHQEKITRT